MNGSDPVGAPRPDRRAAVRHRAGSLLAAALWSPAVACASPLGTDVPLELGSAGWTLEYFGREVAILRAGLTRRDASGSSGEAGGVILSCSGGHRRLTVRLPGPAGPSARQAGGGPSGSLLIRAPRRGASAPFVIAPAQPSRAGTFSATGEAGARLEPVANLARLLLEPIRQLDVLRHDGPGPVTLASLTPLHVSVTLRADDVVAVRAFLSACTGAPPVTGRGKPAE